MSPSFTLRRSLSGCMLCTAGAVALLEVLHVLGGLINDLAGAGALLLVALGEWFVTLISTPAVYFLFYHLYRKAGGKPV